MIVYRVFYKDYNKRTCRLLGVLKERRKSLRGVTPLQSGLRWARFSFGGSVANREALLVVPKALGLTAETWDVGTRFNDTLGTGPHGPWGSTDWIREDERRQ